MLRIITEQDIRALLDFADSNLSTYKVLYKKYANKKMLYWGAILFAILTFLLCVFDLYILYCNTVSMGIIIINLFQLVVLLYLYSVLNKFRSKMLNHAQIQRLKLLKKFYQKIYVSRIEYYRKYIGR